MGQFLTISLTTVLLWAMVASCTPKNKSTTADQLSPMETIDQTTLDTTSVENIPLPKAQDQESFLESGVETSASKKFKYNLSKPANTSILSAELMEISALSYDVNKNVLYAVNDEKGNLYTLNPLNGKITDKSKFGKKGDYEGVEISKEGVIYTVTSNGNITSIQSEDGTTEKFKTKLRTSNDVEGLGYRADQNLLLLACKGSPNFSIQIEKSKKVKNVYGWSIQNQELIEEPILSIGDDALLAYLEKNAGDFSKSRMKKYKKRAKNFSPSGIAYHTIEDLYYLISSVGKLLITVDQASTIHHIEFLDDTYFAQPEGICFGKDNVLFISNEGKGLVPKLMQFDFLAE